MRFQAMLLDLEGVLYQEGAVIPGAPDAIAALRERGVDLRFLTNTTTRPRSAIVTRMTSMGFDVALDQVFTPARAAVRLLEAQGVQRIHLAADPSLAEDLAAFELADEDVGAVIVGDLFKEFTWDRLNAIFRMLADGARLIALHKNRYCQRGDALALDAGPFVAALEYAAATEAVIVGKPSEPFFASAITDLGVDRNHVLMIGDDIEADIGGAVAAGLAAIQVRTGKYRSRDTEAENAPLARLDSISDLPHWLGENN